MSENAPFDPSAIGARSAPKRVRWSARDAMLYALGVGADTDDLEFTTNNTRGVEQRTLPTMPVTLGVDFGVLAQAGHFDWAGVLHAEQSIELLGEIPVDGEAEAVSEITHMWDKQKAALVTVQTTGTATDGTPLWRSSANLFIRGVGGWGGDRGPSAPTDDAVERGSTTTVCYETRPEQALLYRLSGDYNPLHSDPAFARRAGMERPILHGLCTFGFAGRAVLQVVGKEKELSSVSARFAGPVLPGDTLNVDVTQLDSFEVRFSVRGAGDKEVLTNGRATVAP